MNDSVEINVDPEFQSLLQLLSDEEYQGLEEDIIKRGCLNPIITWNGLVVDGHNRRQICRKLEIVFETKEIHFEDRDEAKLWILEHQLKRRNLNDFQRGELVLRRKMIIAQQAKENQRAGGGSVRMKSDKPIDTLEEMAQMAGVSRDTLFKIEKIAEEAPEEEKKCLRTGEKKINSVYKKLRTKEEQLVEEDCDPQEKQLTSLIDGIELKVVKLEKVKGTIPQLLIERVKNRLISLSQKIPALYSEEDDCNKAPLV